MRAGKHGNAGRHLALGPWTRSTSVAVARLRVVFATLAFLPAAAALAQQTPVVTGEAKDPSQAVDFYVSQKALQAQYARDLDISHLGTTRVRAGFFYNEDRDLILVADLLAYTGKAQDPRNRRLEFRVGTRAYAAFLAVENNDVFSVAIGGEAEWFFLKDRGASLLLSAYYAPDITSFGEANNISDTALRLMLRLNDQASVYVGYRLFTIDQIAGERDVDDNVHIGIQFRF